MNAYIYIYIQSIILHIKIKKTFNHLAHAFKLLWIKVSAKLMDVNVLYLNASNY